MGGGFHIWILKHEIAAFTLPLTSLIDMLLSYAVAAENSIYHRNLQETNSAYF